MILKGQQRYGIKTVQCIKCVSIRYILAHSKYIIIKYYKLHVFNRIPLRLLDMKMFNFGAY